MVTHDAVLHLHPHLFPLSARIVHDRLYGWSARNATLVITDSTAAADDIAQGYGVPHRAIRVVHLAPDPIFRPLQESAVLVRPRLALDERPFFLFVGKLSGRRHIPTLLAAFAELKRRASLPHTLVLVGLNIHDLDLGHLARQLGIDGAFLHHERVTDDELLVLYNTAEAFISPSVYETVSLPVMEAQACGTPVICIDTAGMREITAGAALLIPRLAVGELSAAMRQIVEDVALRTDLRERGLASARRFSWLRCSRETLEVLREAAGI